MKKALAITACDRVEYFNSMAISLGKNNIEPYDIHIFVDFQGIACVNKYKKILEDNGINFYTFHIAEKKLGCGLNIIKSRMVLFDEYGYDFVVYSDEDVIFSKSFLDINTKLIEWGCDNWDNIGLIGLWNTWNYSVDEKRIRLGEVYGNTNASMTCGMTKECWFDIREEIINYVSLCGEYLTNRNRNGLIETSKYIYSRFIDVIPSKVFNKKLNPYFDYNYSVESQKDMFINVSDSQETTFSGQDIMFPIIINKKGWCGLTTVVNRVLPIGKIGVHATPEAWVRSGMDKINMEEFEEDEYLKEFKLIVK